MASSAIVDIKNKLNAGNVISNFNFPNVNYPSGSGTIDVNGDPSSTYDVINAQAGQSSYVVVSRVDAVNSNIIDIAKTVYAGGSTLTPLDNLLFTDYLSSVQVNSGIGAFFIGLNLLTIIAIMGCFGFYVFNRDNSSIRATSVNLSLLVLVGLFIACFNVFSMIGNINNFQCLVDIWTIGISYAVVMGTISIKLIRLYRIFNGNKIGLRGLTDFYALIQCAMIVSVEICFLIVWSLVDPPKQTLLKLSPTAFQYTCASKQQYLWIGIFIAINFILMCTATSFAVLTRTVNSAFNETKFVGMAVYNQMVFITIALVVLLVGASTLSIQTVFAIKQSVIILIIWLMLGLLFIHKIYYLQNHKSKSSNTNSQIMSTRQSVQKGPDEDAQLGKFRPIPIEYKVPGIFSSWLYGKLYFIQTHKLLVIKRLKTNIEGVLENTQANYIDPMFFLNDQKDMIAEQTNTFVKIKDSSVEICSLRFETKEDATKFAGYFSRSNANAFFTASTLGNKAQYESGFQ